MKKLLSTLLICLMVMTMAVGCGDTTEDNTDRTLKLACAYDVSGMYPYKAQATQGDGLFGSLIYDPLMRISGEDRHEEMDLAESYEYNKDKTTLTFHLREGVKFHNGTDFTAEDVVFSYDHYMKEGYDGAFTGVKEVKAIDDYTVVFELDFPYAALVPNEVQKMVIISKDYYEEVGNADAYAEAPVGTGPYKFVSWEKNAVVELEAFEDNYKGAPNIKKIEVSFMTDASARANALEAGDVDYGQIDSSSISTFKDNEEVTMIQEETPSCNGPIFNMSVKEFANKKVRQAIAYAIDRDQMTAAVFPDGGAEATSVWVPSVVTGYTDDVPQYTYDVEKAKALMAEAGYPNGFDAGEIMCNSVGSAPAQVLQAQLEAIGITTKIQTLETAAYYDALFKRDYSLAWMNFGPETLHIADVSKLFATDGSLNFNGYGNKQLDELFDQVKRAVDAEESAELSQKIGTIIQEDVPWIKCYARNEIIVLSNDLEGYEHVDMGLNLYTLHWK